MKTKISNSESFARGHTKNLNTSDTLNFRVRPIAKIHKGRPNSLTAAAAYQRRARLYELDETHDFAGLPADLIFAELMVPQGAPPGLEDIEDLCLAMDMKALFKDSLLGLRAVADLPKGPTRRDHLELIRRFARETFLYQNLAADWAYHSPRLVGKNVQDHVHFLIPVREITHKGIGRFRSDLAKKNMGHVWKHRWSEVCQRL